MMAKSGIDSEEWHEVWHQCELMAAINKFESLNWIFIFQVITQQHNPILTFRIVILCGRFQRTPKSTAFSLCHFGVA